MGGRTGISNGSAFFMIAVALLIDGLQILLDLVLIGFLLDPLLDILATIIFAIWFSHHGQSVMSAKRAGGFLVTVVAELVPGFDAIPMWTFFVAYTVIKSRAASAAETTAQQQPFQSPWRL